METSRPRQETYLGCRFQDDLFVQKFDHHLHVAFFRGQMQAVQPIL